MPGNETGPNNTDKVEKVKPAEVKDNTTKAATGSPVTAGTKDTTDLGHGGKDATKVNESPTKVGAETADNSPATGPGNHANVAGATQDAKNPDVVTSADAPAKKTISDAELDAASKEPESPVPSDAELDEADGIKTDGAETVVDPQDEQERFEVNQILDKIAVLALDRAPRDTPDSFNLISYSGVSVSLGDLRRLSRAFRKG